MQGANVRGFILILVNVFKSENNCSASAASSIAIYRFLILSVIGLCN